MDERLQKLKEAIARCEVAALRLARREATLREAARETVMAMPAADREALVAYLKSL